MKILVVEDDALLRHHLCYQLSNLGHRAHGAEHAEEGLYYAAEYNIDIAIIDLGLPGMSGIDMITQLRSQGYDFPILILTARGSWQDKVSGLDAGADDFVVKPFQFEELQARINALVRRASGFSQAQIEAGPFRLDMSRKQAFGNENPISLTAYEYKILEYMMRHHQQVISKDRLVEQLYDDDDGRDSNVIEVLVGRLRKKLEKSTGTNPIDTIRGQGYLFNLLCR